ncbi:MAG: UrcA family protein [Gammaproteobacteria bacterium]|nr:UrcA family protein [Gammaproteobacteria bacterium]
MRTFKLTALQVLPVLVAMAADSCFDSRTVAWAAPGGDPPSLKVSLKDLDLGTRAGAVTAYARIRNAARSVCGIVDVFPEERAAWDRCVDATIGRAVTDLGANQVTDCYLVKAHRPRRIKREVTAGTVFAGQ